MKPDWLSDARLIPDEVMSYIRKIAVNAVKEKNFIAPGKAWKRRKNAK
ncbi:hypothetical protein U5801_23160 [Lamprobacter modestohalophilus]|nr:hypothetical protein [Lamprobacter modestohalophilus]MEA1052686.1 hypothetical protein [Lamprobacter modestohalophilus]